MPLGGSNMEWSSEYPPQEQELVYALDIGTRSVIGVLAKREQDRMHVLMVEKQPHRRRAMLDGQIENIHQVTHVVQEVTQRLEERSRRKLTRACVAAAGRALRAERGHSRIELPAPEIIQAERIEQLELDAVSDAEHALREADQGEQRMFLVGYTVTQLQLDRYPLTSLEGHTGQLLEADVVATFLPSEVIDSLYAVMREAGLEVASLTLEPIAALNAAIPEDIRLLNLALVDIGAGTSDIALCRDGSVVGYTMATVAGDEITEALMRECLVSYAAAEEIKLQLGTEERVTFTDVVGMEQTRDRDDLLALAGLIQCGSWAQHPLCPDCVGSSGSLGLVAADETKLEIYSFLRSYDDAVLQERGAQYALAAEGLGFSVWEQGYGAWPGVAQDPLTELFQTQGRQLGLELNKTTAHVGLEASVFHQMAPEMPIVSVGMEILDPHSVHERVKLDTIEPFGRLLAAVIREYGK